jgi:hypothetical protein
VRPISGFERPLIQWLFVLSSAVLITAAVVGAWTARRANIAADAARSAELTGRLEREQLDAQLARERSAREALTLELARLRQGGAEPMRVVPTLTLTPLTKRGATPPPPTATSQHATQLIELRLVLPPAGRRYTRFEIVVRDWSSGDILWSRAGLASSTIDRQTVVTGFVAGDVFRAGAYELLLSGRTAEGQKEEVASYEITFK